MRKGSFICKIIAGLFAFMLMAIAQAGVPLWTFQPLTKTHISVATNASAIIKYQVTNQSKKTHTLVMTPIAGISQQVDVAGSCAKSFTLASMQSCILTLQVKGSQLSGAIAGGPIVCERSSPLQCYQPGAANTLGISVTQSTSISLAATASTYTKVGSTYYQANTASGGTAPYAYSISAGSVPTGTALNSTTGVVSGTPTVAGAFRYTVKVADYYGTTAFVSSGGSIDEVFVMTATPSTYMEVGIAYSQVNTVSYGSSPYSYSLLSGTLPAGTTLDPATGAVSGIPTVAGAFNYTIQATDNDGKTTTAVSSGVIAGVLGLAATPSTYTEVGVAYSQSNTPSGGTAPFSYSLSTGTLPAGTILNSTTGTVSGSPTTAGAFSYTIQVTDHAGATATASSSGTVIPVLSLSSTASTNTEVSVAYSQTNVASGGTGSYTYSISAGTLPAGLTLNTSTGAITGAPTTAGAFSYTVKVVDTGGGAATRIVNGTIVPLLTMNATASTHSAVGETYAQANVASGGTGIYSYSLDSGTVPAGTAVNTSTGTVSGIPSTSGTFSYTMKAVDTGGGVATQTVSGTIQSALSLTSISSLHTEVGVAYSQTNSGSDGTGSYTYSISAGSVPAGTTLNSSTGTVSGTPTTSGSFSYTMQVIDAGGAIATQVVSGTIAPLLTLAATASTYREVGVAYSQDNTASGGTGSYTYNVSSGTLPAGVSLDTSTGLVSGTPTTSGAFSYTIRVVDTGGGAATKVVSGTILSAVSLVATASTYTEVGVAYSQANAASGGTGSYTYSVSSGTVPAGTTLNTSTGLVSGTPTTAGVFSYTIQVVDTGGGVTTQTVSGTMEPVLGLAATASTYTEVGVAYSQSNTASGGTGSYTYSVSSGTLPAGTTLNTSTGLVSGTPTTTGAFSYTIRVVDTGGGAATQTQSGTIAPVLSLAATASTYAEVAVAYSQSNTASGGTGSYTYSLATGTLPAGTSLNTSTGLVSGTPTTAGAFSYTIQVVDTGGGSATRVVSGTVATALGLVATASTYAAVGEAYSQSNTASGGTGSYTYSVSIGTLPAGTTLNTSTGLVFGTPTTAGAFSYTIQVADTGGGIATQAVSGTVGPVLNLAATASTYAEVGVAYSQSNTASGGTGSYVYSVSSGTLPAGTTLNTSTGLVSGTPTTSGAFSYTIRVVDAGAGSATQTVSGTVAPVLGLAATVSTYTEVGVTYSQSNAASGGTGSYTYSVFSGTVPAGTTLNTSTGLVSGTPTTAGAFSYTIQVVDTGGGVTTQTISGTMASVLGLVATPSTYAEVGIAYSQSNTASGGTGSYTYSVSSGILPAGTNLNTSTGLVSGTPTTAGAFSYTIRAVDTGGGAATQTLNGTIVPVLGLAATVSTYTQVGLTYSQSNTVSGGTSPYSYSLSSGTLPAGTTLNSSTGLVSGTPTTAGAFSYVISVTDNAGAIATASSSGTMIPVLDLSTTPSTETYVGVAYSQSNTASGGTSPYTYSVSAGSLPAGTTLDPATGTVSGIPTSITAINYTIKVTDNNGATATVSSTGNITLGAVLTAVGAGYNSFPVVLGTNGAQDWSVPVSTGIGNYTFSATSCTGTDSTAICTAVGQEDGNYPLLYVSTNGGSNWDEVITSTDLGNFSSTSCTGTGSTAICTAVGADATSGSPLFYVSTDGASTWNPVTTATSSGYFTSTSCSGTGSTAICTVVGQDSASGLPLLYLSTDGASTWNLVNLTADQGVLVATSCTGTGATTVCIAAGYDLTTHLASLYRSTDGGSTWSFVTTSSLPSGSSGWGFSSTSCTGSGNTAICMAAGTVETEHPIIYVSTDGANTWNSVTTTSNYAWLYSASCSGTGSNAICMAGGWTVTGDTSLVFISTDGGNNWSQISPVSGSGKVNTTTCTGEGSTAVCVLGGAGSNAFLYVSRDGGSTWSAESSALNQQTVQATSCIGSDSTARCLAVGITSQSPLLFASSNAGDTWNSISTGINFGSLSSSSCTGIASTAICTAVGQDSKTSLPLLYTSTDGGSSWNTATTSSNPGYFSAASCTGTGNTAVCTAAGQDTTTFQAMIYVSQNGGGTWNRASLSTDIIMLNSTSCTGTGSTAICTAVGMNYSTNLPVLYLSTNGGSTWSSVTTLTDGGAGGGEFYSTSCTGSGSTAICIAVGADISTNTPLIYMSINGGSSWSPVTTTSDQGYFQSASCTGTGSTAVCTAAGADDATGTPLLYISTNGGNTWSSVTTTSDNGHFQSTSCSTTGGTVICTAAGSNDTTGLPLLYVSSDGGFTWNGVATSLDSGTFNATFCTGLENVAVCTAAGQDNNTNIPMLYMSSDRGTTWSIVGNTPSTLGNFASAGGSD
jgi:hypothetical protein